jgi:hypothetical protein
MRGTIFALERRLREDAIKTQPSRKDHLAAIILPLLPAINTFTDSL